MPVATMELKDSFGFWMIAINWGSFNESFTPVATFVMMNVCHSLMIHALANKFLWYRKCLLGKKPSRKQIPEEGSDFQGK